MKFISAGHCNKPGPTYDSGAPGVDGRLEANETVKVRNRVIQILKDKLITDIVQDADGDSLAMYLNRIKPGNASVVVEFHFDAYSDPARPAYRATGTTAIVSVNPTKESIAMGKELATITSQLLHIPVRDGGDGDGVMTEADSHRGRLGLMRKAGTVVLLEICFIDNPQNMSAFDANFEELCQAYAAIIQKYDDLIK